MRKKVFRANSDEPQNQSEFNYGKRDFCEL